MITCTTVQTNVEAPQPPVHHLVLKMVPQELRPISREVLDIALDKLGIIVDEFRDWDKKDTLSAQLIDWSFEVLFDDGYSEMLDDEYIDTLTKRIHQLTHEILVNPLDGAPLEDPLIVDQSLWERWMWNDFNQLCPRPNSVVTVHSFAQEMIRWRKSLPIKELNPTIDLKNTTFAPLQAMLPADAKPFLNRQLFENNNNEASKILKVLTYCQLASNAIIVRKLDNLTLSIKDATIASREIFEICRQKVAAHAEIAQKEGELHYLKIKNHLDRIQNSHQQEVQILGILIENQRKQIQETRKRLEQTEIKCALNDYQIRQLRQELVNQQGSIAQLQRKGKKKRTFGIF